jgi:hypothetical protein
MLTRRDMISMAGQAALAAAVTRPCAAGAAAQPAAPSRRPTFCMFPKPLPELGWRALGGVVRDAGFEGVDLTVRARGHVLPERATEDLPRAVEAISASGLSVPMITTDLTSARSEHARSVLESTARNDAGHASDPACRRPRHPRLSSRAACGNR